MAQKAASVTERPSRGPARSGAEQAKRRRRLRSRLAVVAVAVVVLAGLIIVVVVGRDGPASKAEISTSGPRVGGDLHALAAIGSRLFVSGHGGAGVSVDGGRSWTQLVSLNDKDAMGWATSGSRTLTGGHEGLYESDDGSTFTAVSGLPVSDVHGLGAAGRYVYLASPQGGVFASTDGGRSWQPRGPAGAAIMGSIVVDASKPLHLIAADMSAGVVASDDGGASWRSWGGPMGAMSVDRNPADPRELVAVGMNGAERSNDGGRSWQPMATPEVVSSVAFVPGQPRALISASLEGGRAQVYSSRDGGASWAPTAGA